MDFNNSSDEFFSSVDNSDDNNNDLVCAGQGVVVFLPEMNIACDAGFVGNECHCFYKSFSRKLERLNARPVLFLIKKKQYLHL